MKTTGSGRRHGPGRVALLAVLDEVRNAIGAGWSESAVYEMHREELADISLRQFITYVRRYVKRHEQRATAIAASGLSSLSDKTPEQKEAAGADARRVSLLALAAIVSGTLPAANDRWKVD